MGLQQIKGISQGLDSRHQPKRQRNIIQVKVSKLMVQDRELPAGIIVETVNNLKIGYNRINSNS